VRAGAHRDAPFFLSLSLTCEQERARAFRLSLRPLGVAQGKRREESRILLRRRRKNFPSIGEFFSDARS